MLSQTQNGLISFHSIDKITFELHDPCTTTILLLQLPSLVSLEPSSALYSSAVSFRLVLHLFSSTIDSTSILFGPLSCTVYIKFPGTTFLQYVDCGCPRQQAFCYSFVFLRYDRRIVWSVKLIVQWHFQVCVSDFSHVDCLMVCAR